MLSCYPRMWEQKPSRSYFLWNSYTSSNSIVRETSHEINPDKSTDSYDMITNPAMIYCTEKIPNCPNSFIMLATTAVEQDGGEYSFGRDLQVCQ